MEMYDVTLTITVTAEDEADASQRIHDALLEALTKDGDVLNLDAAVIRGWSDTTVEVSP